MTSLNPLFTVGTQLGEVLRRHMGMSRKQAKARAIELLELVGISFPRQRVKQYPHEFSGGMRQRVMIAMALACEPELLIADEPTTALDVTIQAQILELVADLRDRLGLAVLLISHDLGVVAGLCDRVAVMYGGTLVETGSADDVFRDPGHPYARGLLRSTPRLDVVLPRLVAIEGSPPDLLRPPQGCPFQPRCPLAVERCVTERPLLDDCGDEHGTGRAVACWKAFVDNGVTPVPDPVPAEGVS
jgi:oligopeptide/dipeptide ABC transporter ATP-binding protein